MPIWKQHISKRDFPYSITILVILFILTLLGHLPTYLENRIKHSKEICFFLILRSIPFLSLAKRLKTAWFSGQSDDNQPTNASIFKKTLSEVSAPNMRTWILFLGGGIKSICKECCKPHTRNCQSPSLVDGVTYTLRSALFLKIPPWVNCPNAWREARKVDRWDLKLQRTNQGRNSDQIMADAHEWTEKRHSRLKMEFTNL